MSQNDLSSEIGFGIKLSLDNIPYKIKPIGNEVGQISKRIAKNKAVLNNLGDIIKFKDLVGQKGYSFCPATFNKGIRSQDNFEQTQLLVLDFDRGISFIEVYNRAEQYNLSMLFAYETFSSVKHDKFRVLFLNDTSITDKRLAKISLNSLYAIFPEADQSCNDIAKLFFGGKNLLYFDYSIPNINTELLLRNLSFYFLNEKGPTHYKRYIKAFADKDRIRLNNKGLFDITPINIKTELVGTNTQLLNNGKNSPNAIILTITGGEKLQNLLSETNSYYKISLWDGCTPYSVKEKRLTKHKPYRLSDLKNISNCCFLFKIFESGERKLHHFELFGISTNIIHVESGRKVFMEILSRNHNYYDKTEQERWDYFLKYNSENDYCKMDCNKFCLYKDTCQHGINILSTVRPKRGIMEKIPNYMEAYYPIEEVQEDVKEKLIQAIESDDSRWQIVKAQTAIGKTETYLELMKNLASKFLIAVPTNKLKQDIYSRAVDKRLKVIISPSIDEIKDDIPSDVWNYICFLRRTGQHSKVFRYICKITQEQGIECLVDYLDRIREFKSYSGNTITTHRRLMNMSVKILKNYDAIILDEDIIFSSIVSNQCEIPISVLNKMLKLADQNPTYSQLSKKIKNALKIIETKTLFSLPGFYWEDISGGKKKDEGVDDICAFTDIPSFCQAERFMYRKYSNSIVFIKPYKFFKNVKYIMVSATVDKDICEYCFGKQNVKFYECITTQIKGALNQYYEKSMSRTCIDKNPGILERIQKWSGFQRMITFKKYGISDFYFGNAIGCDNLKGQNINVVGTPYHADFLYKLLPFTLGLNVDGNAAMKSCLVNHNGYGFRFTTFGEEHNILRKFHLWMIESELEQAVGRARLLRNDCTVNLFSNFPLRQAVMKESLELPIESEKEEVLEKPLPYTA